MFTSGDDDDDNNARLIVFFFFKWFSFNFSPFAYVVKCFLNIYAHHTMHGSMLYYYEKYVMSAIYLST